MHGLGVATAFATALVLVSANAALAPPGPSPELFGEELRRLQQSRIVFEDGGKGGSSEGIELVGYHDIGGRGFNADVWAHEGFAYVGQWGFTDWAQGSNDRFCPDPPENGVAVVDYGTDPSNPVLVSTLDNPTGTSAEDVVVHTALFGPMAGHDIAVTGIQVCGGSRYDRAIPRGLMLFDVTNPAAPVQLGFLDTGCCTRGVHEFAVEHRPDLGRTFAYATVPASEYEDDVSPSGRRDEQGRGDFRLIDITNPTDPVEVSDWGVRKDAGGPLQAGRGCDPDPIFGHGAEPTEDGREVFVAYWDSGFVALDLSDPAAPVMEGHTVYRPNEDGDGHSSDFDDARQLLFTADEDFCPNSGPGIERGWGYLRVFDYSDRAGPVEIGQYRTPSSITSGNPASGDYTVHNPHVVGTKVYVSWYSDGIRVVDARDPANLRETAFFVPPAGKNPVKPSQRFVLSQTPQVWGVFYDVDRDLILGSDMNTGLWILRETG